MLEDLAAPDTRVQLEALADRADLFVCEERIRRGDTIGTLLTRLGVSDADAERFLRTSADARALQQLRPGRLIQVRTDDEGALQWLRYAYSSGDAKDANAAQNGRSLVVERQGDAMVAHEIALPNERRVELRSGEIRSSLFAATDDAGLPDGIATQIAEIFSGDIDFYRDLRRGDRFRVVYESFYQGGEFVRAGRILAIEFVNAGKPHAALWYGGASATDGTRRRSLLRLRRTQPAPRVPAHAARVHAHQLRLRRPPASDRERLAPAHRRRLRGADRHAGARPPPTASSTSPA